MSSIIDKIKEKVSSKPQQKEEEQSFSIQPHPAVSVAYVDSGR